jgi:ribosomal protein L9
MVPLKNLENLKTRNDRYNYSGKLSKYQQEGSKLKGKRYFVYEVDEFNNYQNFLYRRALFGLKVYKPEEIKTMFKDKKERIEKVHKRAQNELNLWKQTLTNNMFNALFAKYFSKSPMGKELLTTYGSITDPKYINKINFKDLGVKKKDVVNKLIELGVLPKNFYELKNLETCK